MDLFWTVGLYLMFFILIYGNYGVFAVTVCKWSKKPIIKRKNGKEIYVARDISTADKVKCFIPLLQAVKVKEALYGKKGFFAPLSIVSAVLIILRLLNAFFISVNSYFMFFTIIGLYIGIILHLLIYAIITADCAKMYNFSWLTIILNFLFPYWACWYLKNNVPNKMRALFKEETFSEHKSDTIIKSKSNE